MSRLSPSTGRPSSPEQSTRTAPAEGPPADRFMRRLLRVNTTDPNAVFGARSAMRRSIIISGIRCTITYLVVPILVPILGFMGTFAAPVSLVLCTYAIVNGVISVRNFWLADHRARWKYTYFMGVIFILLLVAIGLDVATIIGAING